MQFLMIEKEPQMKSDNNLTQIYSKLTEIFRDVFDDDSLQVTPELTAADVDEWDSLNHIRLVVSIERAFGLSFSAAQVGRLKNVGEFAELIVSKL
jgi:acyl carrier protein